jgi:Sulfate transporter CysZ/Etoposide-induced protein 2.4
MMMKKKNLFSLSVKDFFTPYFLGLALMPLFLTLVILFAGLGYGMSALDDTMKSVKVEKNSTSYSDASGSHSESSVNISFDETEQGSTPFYEINPVELFESLQSSEILSSMLQNDILRWIIEKVVLLVAGYFVFILAVIIAVTVVGFFTPLVVKKLKSRHYPPFEIRGHGSIISVLWHTLKSLFIMLVLYFILIPFYFIPLVNIIAFNLPAYYFFHKMLVFDVGSEINTKKEFVQIKALVSNQIRIRTLFMYMLTLIPFVGIFFPVLFVIYLSHIFINESLELRAVTG